MVIPLEPDTIPAPGEIGIPASHPTLAERMQQRGYTTAAIGKWHLGSAPTMRPTAKGFDEFFGFLGGSGLFAPVDAPWVVNARLDSDFDRAIWARVTNAVLDQDQVVHPEAHLTDVFADEAVDFIERNSDDPFFLYLAFNAPHNPLQARRDYYDRLAFIEDHETRVYYAMVEQMDDAIGRVIAAVESAGKAEDTLIIFTSDNGGAHYTGIPHHNLPYRGWKGTYYEGGVVVPLHMYWPGRIAPNGRVLDPVSLLDIAPTALQASGMPAPASFDGQTLIDANGALVSTNENRPFFWRTEHYRVVRQGRYKLQITEYPEATRLYDLVEDPTERVDIAETHSEIVDDLRNKLEAWEATVQEPRWPAIQRLRIKIDGYQNSDIDSDYIFFAL
jgi:arylsulfatase A-like enzyme